MPHPDYKNVRIKNKVWDQIAKEMRIKQTGDDLKKRWKNLRDCFSKHLRSEKTRTGQAAKSISRYKTWPWAQHMETFRPFLQFAVTDSNITDTDIASEIPETVTEEIEIRSIQNEATETSENILSEVSTTQETEKLTKIVQNRRSEKKRKSMENLVYTNTSSVDKVITFLTERQSDNKKDCIDLKFQGYAASVKNLSKSRQIKIKYKIAQMIMEKELAQEMETENQSRPGTGYSTDSAGPFSDNMQSPPNGNAYPYYESLNSRNRNEISDNDNTSTAAWYEHFSQSNNLIS